MPASTRRSSSNTQIADLRAGLRAAREKPKFDKAPPSPKKPKKGAADFLEERAEKAERQSMQQHTTSLLTGKVTQKAYVRVGERHKPSGSILGLMFQILFVVGLVGGVAYAFDPTLVPLEWNAKAYELIDQIKSHDMIKQWLPG